MTALSYYVYWCAQCHMRGLGRHIYPRVGTRCPLTYLVTPTTANSQQIHAGILLSLFLSRFLSPRRPTNPSTMATAFDPQDFLDGWRKLPDELKLMVLGYALPHNLDFTSFSFSKTRAAREYRKHMSSTQGRISNRSRFYDGMQIFQTDVFPLLACGEIRHLVFEAFYNRIRMVFFGNPLSRSRFPPSSVSGFVRLVLIPIKPSSEQYADLEKLANGALCMQNLKDLKIHISFERKNLANSALPKKMQSRTQRLEVMLKREYRKRWTERISEDFEKVTLSSFDIVSGRRDVSERTERSYFCPIGSRDLVFVDTWPKWVFAPGQSVRMRTRKVVSV